MFHRWVPNVAGVEELADAAMKFAAAELNKKQELRSLTPMIHSSLERLTTQNLGGVQFLPTGLVSDQVKVAGLIKSFGNEELALELLFLVTYFVLFHVANAERTGALQTDDGSSKQWTDDDPDFDLEDLVQLTVTMRDAFKRDNHRLLVPWLIGSLQHMSRTFRPEDTNLDLVKVVSAAWAEYSLEELSWMERNL